MAKATTIGPSPSRRSARESLIESRVDFGVIAGPTRLVRAKRTLSEARVPFEAPSGRERAARLESVLEVVYLVFNEGYSATAGDDWIRPSLCAEALRLGRVLAGLAPAEPEVHGSSR